MNVTIDGLADAISNILTEYSEEVNAATKRAVETVAEECRKDISNNATVFHGSKYAKSWRKKLSYGSAKESRYTVYSTKYQLTHLLEYGHEKWLWGHYTGEFVNGKAHIRPAELRAEENLVQTIKRNLS